MGQERTAKPRKTPQQKRSIATVKAIREATLELLLVRTNKLTTNEVAVRAGVSIGTLYQYFANETGLFQEIFRHQFLMITESVEEFCEKYQGQKVEGMSQGLVQAFMGTALGDLKSAKAQHAVSEEALFREIVPPFRIRQERAICALLAGSDGRTLKSAEIAATVIFSSLAGNTRSLLDKGAEADEVGRVMMEVELLIRGYLETVRAKGLEAD